MANATWMSAGGRQLDKATGRWRDVQTASVGALVVKCVFCARRIGCRGGPWRCARASGICAHAPFLFLCVCSLVSRTHHCLWPQIEQRAQHRDQHCELICMQLVHHLVLIRTVIVACECNYAKVTKRPAGRQATRQAFKPHRHHRLPLPALRHCFAAKSRLGRRALSFSSPRQSKESGA